MVRKSAWIVLLCAFVFLLIGCSGSYEEKILGVWYYEELRYDSAEKTEKTVLNDALTFAPNNVVYWNLDNPREGTYILDGDTLTLIWKNYKRKQDTFTIEKLTKNELVLRRYYNKGSEEVWDEITFVKNR